MSLHDVHTCVGHLCQLATATPLGETMSRSEYTSLDIWFNLPCHETRSVFLVYNKTVFTLSFCYFCCEVFISLMLFVYQWTHRCVLELYWYAIYVYLSSKSHISLSLPTCGTLQCSTIVWSTNLDMGSVMGRCWCFAWREWQHFFIHWLFFFFCYHFLIVNCKQTENTLKKKNDHANQTTTLMLEWLKCCGIPRSALAL